MGAAKRTLLLGGMVVVAIGLSACRDDALQRDYIEEKGVYEGRPDAPLTAKQQEILQKRVRFQNY